jgi:hypothetical protein
VALSNRLSRVQRGPAWGSRREVLVLSYTASLEFFERFALADARAAGALVTVVSDAVMVRADPASVSRAGQQYLDARAVCPAGAFHPKLLVIVGDGQARVAVGSGNVTMAGWHANAETWTVLRADTDGGPAALRDVSGFLRALTGGPVALSRAAEPALLRAADALDELPAEAPGPRLLHSITEPIAGQLPTPDGPVADLMLYAPFHDGRLDGTRRLLDLVRPASWTVFVQPDTVVDGPTLQALADERGGRVAWVDRRTPDGKADERYWHGKLAQWTLADGRRFALTGSPNLSAPALLRTAAGGGNVELAVLAEVGHDIAPAAGEPPEGGLASLRRPGSDQDGRSAGPILLSAFRTPGTVTVELHRPLAGDGVFERYDVPEDRWTLAAPVAAGADRYELAEGAAPVGSAVRIRTGDGALSNEVFVADLQKVLRPQRQAVGKARVAPEDVPGLGVGRQLLADIEELRPYLLAAGVRQPAIRPGGTDDGSGDESAEGEEAPPARPAPGQTLEEFLDACDAVIGRAAAEFALVLPALPGVGSALDDEQGTLDSDSDEDADFDEEPEGAQEGRTLRQAIRQASPDERQRYRWFVERLVERATGYPPVVRALCARTVLHGIAAQLWTENEPAMALLARALCALAAPGDEPSDDERRAAASLAATGLAVLRTSVPRMSTVDERQMRYTATAGALAPLLVDRDPAKLALLSVDLPAGLAGPHGLDAVEAAVDEILHPPTGVHRAVRLLAEEDGIDAHAAGEATVVLDEPLAESPEPQLVRALRLTDDSGPVFARGETEDGHAVLAAWCAPHLAVEKMTRVGKPMIRVWKLPAKQTLTAFHGLLMMPKATTTVAAGGARPAEVADLLAMADGDTVPPPEGPAAGLA